MKSIELPYAFFNARQLYLIHMPEGMRSYEVSGKQQRDETI